MPYRIQILIIWMLGCLCAFGAGHPRVFTRIDAKDGLSDNHVLHIAQLPDGRMVINTQSNINLLKDGIFEHIHYTSDSKHPLPEYKGFSHTYVSEGNLLWSKTTGQVQCLDLTRNTYVDDMDSLLSTLNADPSPTDLFIDHEGKIWTVTDMGVLDSRSGRRFPLIEGYLQDLETKGDTVMLFYDTGVTEGFDRKSGKLLWHAAAYDDPKRYTATSLVRLSPDGTVLQVRSGKSGGAALFRFDTARLEWTTILETPYMLHTLAAPSDKDAYIASQKGLWHIDLNTLDTRLLNTVRGEDADIFLGEGFNTIFKDKDGGYWIGTYRDGLLYSPAEGIRTLSRHTLKEMGIDSLILRKAFLNESRALTDKRGIKWQATDDGLLLEDTSSGKETILYKEDGLSNNCIKAIAETPDGDIWISTAHGINRLISGGLDDIRISTYRNPYGDYTADAVYLTEDGWPVFPQTKGWTAVLPPATEETPIAFTQDIAPQAPPKAFPYFPYWWVLACTATIGAITASIIVFRQNRKPTVLTDETAPIKISKATYFDEKEASSSVDSENEAAEEEMPPESREFLTKVRGFVESNLASGYTVEKLSSDLCMERTGLYKKLDAVLGISPSAFIRKIRIENAARLVREGELSMNEIADATGFSSASHMSRCFKEEMGCTPTEYSKKPLC